MRIAVVYNRDSKNVINLFGMPNREKIGMKTIERLVKGLKDGGHQVIALEGDKDLLDKLEEFMPRVVHGERPGMVFNVSYGIQGQARYTHVPSILEMAGIPYVASGPLGHSLSLDKVVTKMILKQNGLPTPDFAVLETPDSPVSALTYPAIVKPKNEAVSFGLKVVQNEEELREAAQVIFNEFRQAVLAEQFIEGREVNVGLLGNNPPEPFPPVELSFGKEGPQIYTYEDKTGKSGRVIEPICPARLSPELTKRAQELAVAAFRALGLYDCARVDMRIDANDNLYILETNSLPSLGEHGSYLVGAAYVGLDFSGFVNRLVEVASARYFGTPTPPALDRKTDDPKSAVFSFITQRRSEMEKRVREWVDLSSRTSDPHGCRLAGKRVERVCDKLGLRPVEEFTDAPTVWTWETKVGFQDGTLFIANLDVSLAEAAAHQPFRRSPDALYGEGVGTSRAPLVVLEFALRAFRSARRLRKARVGVLFYTDEGRDAQTSAPLIEAAAARAKNVLVLRPGSPTECVIVRRRGNRRYRLRVVGDSMAPGRATKQRGPLRWAWNKLEQCIELGRTVEGASISVLDMKTESHPMRLPHRVQVTILMTYADATDADRLESGMRETFGKGGPKWDLLRESDRPPMRDRKTNARLYDTLAALAGERDTTLKKDTSAWPSAAGLIPAKVASLCGVGPVVRDRGTPNENVLRISLIRRALLLADYLIASSDNNATSKPS